MSKICEKPQYLNNGICENCPEKCSTCETNVNGYVACTSCTNSNLTGENCEKCKDPLYNNFPDCDTCINTRKDKNKGCKECLPEFKGEDCNKCVNQKFEGSDCKTCKNTLLSGDNCEKCKDPLYNFDTRDPCKTCINTGKDKDKGCTVCLDKYAGDECNECSNHNLEYPSCTKCTKPNYDTDKNCTTCINVNYDLANNCTTCIKSNYDPNKNCETCLFGYDPSKNCETCLTDYDIANKCTTCIKPNYDPANKCQSCLSGYDSTKCQTYCQTACNNKSSSCKYNEKDQLICENCTDEYSGNNCEIKSKSNYFSKQTMFRFAIGFIIFCVLVAILLAKFA
jgi:hypothetical protein